jgi:acetyltransferase-like isoleucine patch superfamily enzyme
VRILSTLFLNAYTAAVRLRCKCFSLLVSGAFARFGRRTVLETPLRIGCADRISIGDGVFVGAGSWLQVTPNSQTPAIAISIGSGTSIAGMCVISAVHSVRLEESVLLARNVYISDHIHKYDERDTPILAQGVDKVAPVVIKRGAWLGQNVVVCPGVTIGAGAVIGANSVVNRDIDDRCVAVGAPARVVKVLDAPVVPASNSERRPLSEDLQR